MEKFSYADEFNRVADVARLGDADDVRISYSVFVGIPNTDGNNPKEFLGGEFVESPSFTTWQDAQNAKEFVECVLLVVDEHEKKNNAVSEVTGGEIYRCVEDSVNSLLKYRNHKDFSSMLIAELTCNLNDILTKNNSR